MIPRAMELYLRVHTVVEGERWTEGSIPYEDRWAKKALILDCETTIDARQTFNFAFYRKCTLKGNSYVCTEEGIVYADDLEERLGKHAVELLTTFARQKQTETVRGRRAKMQVYSRKDFVCKILLPMYRYGAVIVGANLCFDLSRLALGYKDPRKTGVWSLFFRSHNDQPDKILPSLKMTPRNSRSAFLSFTYGHKEYGYADVNGGRFLDVLTLAFAMRNTHYSLDGACAEWNVPGKLNGYKPKGRVTIREAEYCRQDVKCTLDLLNAMKREFDTLPIKSSPEEACSTASLAKAFLDSMGLEHPLEKFSLTNKDHGIAMQSYYGGRAECRIKGIKVPIMFVDFTSQYATCNSLLGTWDYMIARDVKVRDATEEVREFPNSVTLDKMFNRGSWPELNFFALVEPHGDMLHSLNRPDTRRVPLAGDSLRLVSLRWRPKRPLAATAGSAPPLQHHHEPSRVARRNSLGRHKEWAVSWKNDKLTQYAELAGLPSVLWLKIMRARYGPARMGSWASRWKTLRNSQWRRPVPPGDGRC